jgi:hypothetical protein
MMDPIGSDVLHSRGNRPMLSIMCIREFVGREIKMLSFLLHTA